MEKRSSEIYPTLARSRLRPKNENADKYLKNSKSRAAQAYKAGIAKSAALSNQQTVKVCRSSRSILQLKKTQCLTKNA